MYCEPWSPSPTLTLAPNTVVQGAWITNTTYAALSMLKGDRFAKKFGGDSGNDRGLVLVVHLRRQTPVRRVVDFYLADYRFNDNSHDFIVDNGLGST